MDKPEMTPNDLTYVQTLVRNHSAIVLEAQKAYLMVSRLEPLAKKEGFATLEALVNKLRYSPYGPLHMKAVEAMTTNETYFFRDVTPFTVFREQLLPEIIQHNSTKKRLNIWCGASSSGQEPYSILLTILEHFPELRSWSKKFFATDISQEMIARCREGTYSQFEVNRGLPATLLAKHFLKKGMNWQIRDEVRNMLELQAMNLAGNWLAFPKMDFIFLRNVMIYFDAQTKKQILKKIRDILEPHGYLLLGGAESTLNLDDQYERVVVGAASCYRVKKG